MSSLLSPRLEVTGFEVAEADMIILGEAEKEIDPEPEDVIPEMSPLPPVTRAEDVWEVWVEPHYDRRRERPVGSGRSEQRTGF